MLAGKHVVVVGGGPGGIAAAAQAARQGASVDVYDASPAEGSSSSQQWAIALGDISVKAMEALNLRSIDGEHTRPAGTTFHAAGGKTPMYQGFTGELEPLGIPVMHIASRDDITKHMSNEAERVYGATLRQHHSTRLVHADVLSGRLVFEPLAGPHFEVQADLVIGADGAGSLVRQQLQKQVEGFQAERRRCAQTVNCISVRAPPDNALHCLETPSGEPFNQFPSHLRSTTCVLPGTSMGFVTPEKSSKRLLKDGGVIVWPQLRGMIFLVSVWPQWWEMQLDEEGAYIELSKAFPRLPKAFLLKAASELQPGNLNTRTLSHVWCNSLGGGRAILVGDAAHGIPPAIGMGCNSAIADGAELGEAIEATGGDIAQLPEAWTRMRLAEVDAIVSAAEGAYWLRAPKSLKDIGGVWNALPWLAMSCAMIPGASRIPGLKPPYTRTTFFAALLKGDSASGALSSLNSFLLRIAIGVAASVALVVALVVQMGVSV